MDLLQIGMADGWKLVGLQGTAASRPVRGAVLAEPESGEGETVKQSIDVVLEGTAAEIDSFLISLRRELARAEEAALGLAQPPASDYRYLSARVTAGGELRSSKILGGWVELLGGGVDDRAAGSQGVRIHLQRENFWQGGLTWLPITNRNGSGITTGLTIYNHKDSDAGHDNDASASAADALGDLPAPAVLSFEGQDTTDNGQVYTAQAIGAVGSVYTLEGESGAAGSGVTGTITASSGASKGYYQRLAWSGSNDVTVWKANLDPASLKIFQGRAFLPVMRLLTANADAGLWFYWRAAVNFGGFGYQAYDAPGRWLSTGVHHCPGTAVFLPPWPLDENELPPGMALELHARASTTGTHTLDLDCLHLLPLDRWRTYRPVIASYSGLKIYDDPYQGTIKAGDWAIQMHAAEGPGLVVAPGRANSYLFLMEKSGGGFTIDNRATVRIGYYPRWRGL